MKIVYALGASSLLIFSGLLADQRQLNELASRESAEKGFALKKEIARCQELLSRGIEGQKKSETLFSLAMALFKDQELEKAFKYFLESIKATHRLPPKEMCAEEKKLYDEALALYLSECAIDSYKVAAALVARFEEVARQHPDYISLQFLLSTAYGNLGMYDLFFENFYKGYPHLADNFLAHKTQGILYLRLSSHEKDKKMRDYYRKEALFELNLALEKNPLDASLYKVLISLAKDEKDDQLELSYLAKLAEAGTKIPRGDVYPYVSETVSLGDPILGQKILDVAKRHYEYSRVITETQEYLNQHKK